LNLSFGVSHSKRGDFSIKFRNLPRKLTSFRSEKPQNSGSEEREGIMVNPLRGFISPNHRLFEDIDEEGEGIELYEKTGVGSFIERIIDKVTGRAESVTIGGDSVMIDRVSAESFFDRNADRFQGVLAEGMTLQEKLLRLLSLKERERAGFNFSGLPRGLFEEYASGGEEGKKMVIGLVQQFLSLIDALERNGFELPLLRDMIFQSKEKGYLQYDREDFFTQILEENKNRVKELTSSSGRPEVRKLAELLIHRLMPEEHEDIV
jgi:hypothetical protein